MKHEISNFKEKTNWMMVPLPDLLCVFTKVGQINDQIQEQWTAINIYLVVKSEICILGQIVST